MAPRFTPRATKDLRDILVYLQSESPAAANRMRNQVSKTIDLIDRLPQIGMRNALDPKLRSYIVLQMPYRIHYAIEGSVIWIVHIRHTSRRPWTPNVE